MSAINEDRVRSLLSWPLELRLIIYESVLARGNQTSEPPRQIDLFNASPPLDNALLLTCRQLYYETESLYQRARQSYWNRNRFLIQFDCGIDLNIDDICRAIETLDIDHRDLAMVSDVEVVGTDWQELSQIKMRRRFDHNKTTKGDLIELVHDFARNYDRLLLEEWISDMTS